VSKSLQDQLLALGLAKEKVKDKAKVTAGEKPPKPHRPEPHGARKGGAQGSPPDRSSQRTSGRTSGHSNERAGVATPARPAKTPRTAEEISLEQAYRIRENLEKSEKQKERERKLEEDRRRAAVNREIRQIVEAGRLNLPDALEARYFMYKERIRKVHVTPEQLIEVNEGRLGVVYLSGGYHLLTADQVEAVRKLSPAHVPELLVGEADDEELWDAASTHEGETAGD
jgi:uncharacterized protein YaiL (DUF2058 family)